MATSYENYAGVLEAIEYVSQGSTVSKACAKAGVAVRMFHRMVTKNEEFKEMYEEAKQIGDDAMADALVNMHDIRNEYGESDPKRAKITSDNIKWLLERRARDKFGNRVEVKHDVRIDHVITNALREARDKVIDVTPNKKEAVLIESTTSRSGGNAQGGQGRRHNPHG